jgi:hypothetical protein
MKPGNAEDYNCRGYAYFKLGMTRDNFINAVVNYDLAAALGKADYNLLTNIKLQLLHLPIKWEIRK